jgi:hypothetical protein
MENNEGSKNQRIGLELNVYNCQKLNDSGLYGGPEIDQSV